MFKLRKLLIFSLLIIISSKSYSQAFYRYRFEEPWSFSISTGGTQYFGDLYSLWKYGDQPQINPNIILGVRKTVGTNIKTRFDVGFYQISGDDRFANPKSNRTPRNLHFRARNFEASVVGEYYFKPVKLYNITRNFINFYAFIGSGITTNNPKAQLDNRWVPLRPLQLENQPYEKFAVIFPMGLGIKYKLNVYTDLQIEMNYRWSLTDYLDDVSVFNIESFYKETIDQYLPSKDNVYQPERLRLLVRNPNYLLPNGDPDVSKILASQGRIRRGSGLDQRKDGYLTFNVGLEIYLAKDVWDNWIFRNRKNKNYIRFW